MKITKTESGIYIPEPVPTKEEIRAKRQQFYEDYYAAHKCCPRCGGKNIMSTTMGWSGDHDPNHANCQDCRWHGINHDLTPGGK